MVESQSHPVNRHSSIFVDEFDFTAPEPKAPKHQIPGITGNRKQRRQKLQELKRRMKNEKR